MKLISWNVNARRHVEAQADALFARSPDLIGLQEVTARSVASWITASRAGGLQYVRATVAESSERRRDAHAYGVLIASRYPFSEQGGVGFAVPGWQEKVLSQLVVTPLGELALHCAHVPNGSNNGWAKVDVLEAVYAGLSTVRPDRHTLLCGDFNTPKSELASGEIITWAQHVDASGHVRLQGRKRKRPGLRWDAAERNVLSGLQTFGLRDVFRSLHGYEVDACSWVARRKDLRRPRRFDHIFASEQLTTISCEYCTEWRAAGLSDHAAIEAVFVA